MFNFRLSSKFLMQTLTSTLENGIVWQFPQRKNYTNETTFGSLCVFPVSDALLGAVPRTREERASACHGGRPGGDRGRSCSLRAKPAEAVARPGISDQEKGSG